MRAAWLSSDKKTGSSKAEEVAIPEDAGDLGQFLNMEAVSSSWKGPPPILPHHVAALAKAAANKAKPHG